MNIVTFRLRLLLLTALAAAVVVSAALAAPPRYVQRDIAFVTLNGHGTVTSSPRGIACPHLCWVSFVSGTHLVLRAKPAAGWKLASFASKWCKVRNGVCGFDLVSPHNCVGACPIGAYGVRVAFVRR